MYNFNLVEVKNEQAITTSLKVAEYFGKRHDHVLRDIKNIIADLPENRQPIFGEMFYKDNYDRKQPMYSMGRDGFTLLAMGFTGEKALLFKLAYLDEFNHMEKMLTERKSAEWQSARLSGKQVRKLETDVILEKLIPLAISQGSTNYGKLYLTYSKLVNIILGIKAGQRETLPYSDIRAIEFLENAMVNIISIECDKGTNYKEIYQVVKAKCFILRELSFVSSTAIA